MFSPEAAKESGTNVNPNSNPYADFCPQNLSNSNPFGGFPPQDFGSDMFSAEPGNNEDPDSNPFGDLPPQDFSFGIGENFTAMTNDDFKDFMDAEEKVGWFYCFM